MRRRRLVLLVSAITLGVFGLLAIATVLFVTRTEMGREQVRSFIQPLLANRIQGKTYIGKLSGNFPSYERVLPTSHAASLSPNRNDLRSTLERVAQFTESKTRCVVVEVSTNQLCVRAQDGAVGESEESLMISYAGEPARIGFNAAYLADFLNRAEHQNVRLLFNNADTATEWQPASDAAAPDFRYVVMPMRIN